MKLTELKPKENYDDLTRSLRVCAGEDPNREGCEDCIFENTSCSRGKRLLTEAAYVIETLCSLYWEAQKKGAGNESVHELQKEGRLHDTNTYPMQAGYGLGKASAKKAEATAAIEKLIDDLRENARWIEDMPVPVDVVENLRKAARILEIGRQRREYHELGEEIKDRDILRFLEYYG